MNLNRLTKKQILWLWTHRCKHRKRYLEHISCFYSERPNIDILEHIGILDIEASNLNANFGYMFSYCIKELDGELYYGVLSPSDIKRKIFDKKLLKNCISDMMKFDRLVVYYGSDKRFDLPFLRTRAVFNNIDFPYWGDIRIYDLYPVIKAKFKLHSNRLETACDFFGIPCKQHPIKYDIWVRAMSGDAESLQYILTHNIEDVMSTEALFKKVNEFSRLSNTSI